MGIKNTVFTEMGDDNTVLKVMNALRVYTSDGFEQALKLFPEFRPFFIRMEEQYEKREPSIKEQVLSAADAGNSKEEIVEKFSLRRRSHLKNNSPNERSKITATKVLSRNPGGYIKELEITEEAADGSGKFTHKYFLEHDEDAQNSKELIASVGKKMSVTGEDVAALLHGIHDHVELLVPWWIINRVEDDLDDQDTKALERIVYTEEDLLPVLEALGLPAPVWGKGMTVEEWKKQRK